MAGVNKGARKIMTDVPDQLTLVFTGVVLTGVFILVFMAVTYLVLEFTVTSPLPLVHRNERSLSMVDVSGRKFCPWSKSIELNSLSKLGYASADGPRVSPLITLDTTVNDVHYVFGDVSVVPWSSVCSLEATLRTMSNDSRVNVLVVRGVEYEDTPHNDEQLVSLSESLNKLTETYSQLNVVRVALDECLENSPFRGTDLSKRPGLARFVVQLMALWQFGGTVLDSSVTAVRDRVYRAGGTAVEYSARTFSAPVACHAFVFDAIMCAKSYAAHPERQHSPFDLNTVWHVWNSTVEETGRAGRRDQVRPVPWGTVCHGNSVPDYCYYVVTDSGDGNASPTTRIGSRVRRDFCPTMTD